MTSQIPYAGDRYAPLRRAYDEVARLEHQRQQERLAPANVIIPADIPVLPMGSEERHFKQESLLSKLLSMADARPRASFNRFAAQAANSQPILVVDYPGKRDGFVGKSKVAYPGERGGREEGVSERIWCVLMVMDVRVQVLRVSELAERQRVV